MVYSKCLRAMPAADFISCTAYGHHSHKQSMLKYVQSAGFMQQPACVDTLDYIHLFSMAVCF